MAQEKVNINQLDITQLEEHLDEVIVEVEKGETITIFNNGEPYVQFTPPNASNVQPE
jgi:antitoxin (DNA-binding transcriptional repressor) of toxin-antitoxin stability system